MTRTLLLCSLIAFCLLFSRAEVQNTLDGHRVGNEAGNRFLVLDGMLHRIPNDATFANLFKDWEVETGSWVNTISIGESIDDGAFLFQSEDKSDTIYLLNRGKKRPILSFDKYGFNKGKVLVVPAAAVNAVPLGDSLQ
eukprot:c8846_g1_i1.p1 GENE.c8846_g1_i1~~c8846_g1_i1.p1  ORF type:complete len:150 (+),score=42.31 c8846_g1_i1:38-451(+)